MEPLCDSVAVVSPTYLDCPNRKIAMSALAVLAGRKVDTKGTRRHKGDRDGSVCVLFNSLFTINNQLAFTWEAIHDGAAVTLQIKNTSIGRLVAGKYKVFSRNIEKTVILERDVSRAKQGGGCRGGFIWSIDCHVRIGLQIDGLAVLGHENNGPFRERLPVNPIVWVRGQTVCLSSTLTASLYRSTAWRRSRPHKRLILAFISWGVPNP